MKYSCMSSSRNGSSGSNSSNKTIYNINVLMKKTWFINPTTKRDY